VIFGQNDGGSLVLGKFRDSRGDLIANLVRVHLLRRARWRHNLRRRLDRLGSMARAPANPVNRGVACQGEQPRGELRFGPVGIENSGTRARTILGDVVRVLRVASMRK